MAYGALPDEVLVLFDCRMAVWPDMATAFQLIAWRAYDCSVNGVSTAVMNAGAPKEIRNASTGDKLSWLTAATGVLPLPDHEAYGTFMVKATTAVMGVNPLTGEAVEAQRGVLKEVRGAVLRNIKLGKIVVCAESVSVAQE